MASEVWEVRIDAEGPQHESIVNTFHYEWDNAADLAASGQAVAEAWELVFSGDWFNMFTTSYKYVKTHAQCILGVNVGVQGDSFAFAGNLGSNGANGELYTALIIKKLTAFAGRRFRGRLFISPVPDSLFDVNGALVGDTTLFDNVGVLLSSPISITSGPEVGSDMLPMCSGNAVIPSKMTIINYAIGNTIAMRRSRRIRPFS
jgi:hypothetical protein